MIVLGLCGQSGAGKTTALQALKRLGAFVCDCDKVSCEVMSKGTPCSREVIGVFGEEIAVDGEIDRRLLGRIVFFDKEKLARLTEITHRYIKKEIYRLVEEARDNGERLFVIDAPLLFESGLDNDCDITLAIVAARNSRLERIMKRDGIDLELAEKRLSNQLDESELRRRADEVIVNDGTETELEEAILSFAERRGLVR